MNVWLSALLIAFLTALRFAVLPAFVLLALTSFAWRRWRGVWLPLWKLGAVLLAVAVVATLVFTVLWRGAATG